MTQNDLELLIFYRGEEIANHSPTFVRVVANVPCKTLFLFDSQTNEWVLPNSAIHPEKLLHDIAFRIVTPANPRLKDLLQVGVIKLQGHSTQIITDDEHYFSFKNEPQRRKGHEDLRGKCFLYAP